MTRMHTAIATHDVMASDQDGSARSGAWPCAGVPGEYALWRPTRVNDHEPAFGHACTD